MATAGDGFLVASIDSPATGVIVQVDGGGPVAAKRVDGGFMATLPMPERGEHLLVVRGLDFGVQTAYRAVDFDVNG